MPLWDLLVYTRHIYMHTHMRMCACVHVQAGNRQEPRVSKAVNGWGIRSVCPLCVRDGGG